MQIIRVRRVRLQGSSASLLKFQFKLKGRFDVCIKGEDYACRPPVLMFNTEHSGRLQTQYGSLQNLQHCYRPKFHMIDVCLPLGKIKLLTCFLWMAVGLNYKFECYVNRPRLGSLHRRQNRDGYV